jgi:hypothetical protein
MLITLTTLSQTPKFITVKQWKDGVLISSKTYPLVNKVEVTKVKYVPIKSKQKVKIVEVKVPVVKLDTIIVTDTKKIDSLKTLINQYETVNKKTDVIKIKDNLGTVTIKDEIMGNQYVGRNYTFDITAPKPKEKIVEVYRPKTVQWFMGPSITTRVSDPLSQPLQSINLSLLRKGLGDNMLQLSIGGTIREGYMEPKPIIGFGYLLKIK